MRPTHLLGGTTHRSPILAGVVLCLLAASVGSNLVPAEHHDLFRNLRGLADLTCEGCKATLEDFQHIVKSGLSLSQILAVGTAFCNTLDGVGTVETCQGLVDIFGPEVIYVTNHTKVSSDAACFFFTAGRHCSTRLPSWTIELPDNKPPPHHPDAVQGPETVTILHISDTHIDSQYKEGTPVQCEHKLCCRDWSDASVNDGPQAGPKDGPKAGYWGAENGICDGPLRTLDLLLAAAAKHKPDIVYVTGDHPPHDGWVQSRESNLASINQVMGALKKAFPATTTLHSMGNHEALPVNSFAIPAVYDAGWNMTWLYKPLSESWSAAGKLPAEALETVRRGGYFVTSPLLGLRVISVNMNYCNCWNWWLLLDNEDPTGQLVWLTGQLLEAEQAGDKVHILDHISTGSQDCEGVWSHAINSIYSRFESTITAVFSGHDHKDQFKLQWDVEDNTRPTGISYLAPSVTSYERKSPSYRIFTIDGGYPKATWLPLDHFTYSLNLTLANNGQTPGFALAYAAKEAYGLKSLTPQSWADMAWDMASDAELFQEYLRHYYNYWAEPEELATCSTECRKNLLCNVYTGDSIDPQPCDNIMAEVDRAANTQHKNAPFTTMLVLVACLTLLYNGVAITY